MTEIPRGRSEVVFTEVDLAETGRVVREGQVGDVGHGQTTAGQSNVLQRSRDVGQQSTQLRFDPAVAEIQAD